MLEGLEVIELNSKDVYGSLYGRFDAEFFNKKYIENEKSLDFKQSVFLSELAVITDGEHGSPDLDDESGIIYLSGNNVKDNQIDFGNVRYCAEKLHVKNARSSVKKNTVLMSIVGTVGKASVVHDDVIANTDRNVATIKPNTLINPHYLSIFLNCKFSTNQTDRFSTGNVQPLLNLSQLKQIKICNFGMGFQSAIAELSQAQDEKLKQSKASYTQAEQTLLVAVGLADFKPSTQNTNIKIFAQNFGTSGRLDAEYCQPKYEEVVKKIHQYGSVQLEEFIDNYSTGYPYSSDTYLDQGLPLIRINNIKNGNLDISDCSFISEADIALSPKDLANPNDILISMSGSIGNCCKIPNGIKAVVNQRIMRITTKNYDVDVLPIVINSIVCQSHLERIGTGGVQTNISASDIKQIFIPTFDLTTQTKISQLVQQSFRLKAYSEHLLSVANPAVEMAIEQDETAAMHFIENSTNKTFETYQFFDKNQ